MQLTRISHMHTFVTAKGLKNVETLGKMDPYLKLIVGGQTFKTRVESDAGKTPVWNQTFTINVTDVER